jgi:hypothetical protein
MKVVTQASRRNNTVQIMKTKAHNAVGVCRAIRTLLLVGGVALAYCTSTNAAISSGTITLNGASTSSLVITEGVSIALSATFTDSAPTNNDGAVVVWGDNSTNNGVVVLSNLGSNITVTASHQYATTTASPVTVTVTVTNVVGASGANTITSSGDIADAPLSLVSVLSTNSAAAVEGNLTNLTLLTFNDANPLAATNQFTTLTITSLNNAGNVYSISNKSVIAGATTSSNAQFNVQAYLEFYEYGSNSFVVTVGDEGGSSLTATSTVVIADAPLAVVSTGTLVYTEGTVGPTNDTLLTFIDGNTLAMSNQTGGVSQFVAVVIWGDNSTPNTFTNTSNNSSNDTLSVGTIAIQNVASNVFRLVGEHAYPTDGTYFVTIQINDVGGAAPIIVSGIPDSVTDAGLTVVFVNGNLDTLPGFESLAQASGNSLGDELIEFIDTNEFSALPPIDVAPYSFYLATINWGDGSATGTGIVQHVEANEFAVYVNHTYDVTCTNFPLIVKVVDLAGGAFCVSTNSAIIQDAPIIGNGYDIAAAANSIFNGTVAAFTDPDTALNASSFTATIDWGDETPFTAGKIVAFGNGVFLVQGIHNYVAAPLTSETIHVTVTDANVCAAPVTLPATTITFTGTEPGISFVFGNLPTFISVGTATSFTTNLTTFTDSSLPPGDAFDLEALINWGDGTASDGVITTNAANQYVVTGTHTYLDDGTYPVSVEVEDIDGNHNTLSNITIVAEQQYTDLTSSVEVLFGTVKIIHEKSAGKSKPEDYYYDQSVTLVNTSGATLKGPFGLVLSTTSSSNRVDLLNITGQLADGREYVPLSIDTLRPKGKIKLNLIYSDAEQGATGPVILPIRLIAGPGL